MVTYIYSDGSQWYDVVTLQEYENRTFVAPNAKDTIVKVFDTETGKAIYAAPIGEVPRRISTY